jgi:ABC-type multidrug transport system ATPase subunit
MSCFLFPVCAYNAHQEKTMKEITIKNLRKSYGKIVAVNSISFSIAKGALFALLGENGAGKSTTINMLCTILAPDSGEILFEGDDILKKPERAREKIGVVFQSSVLDRSLTVRQNLASRASFHGLYGEQWKTRLGELTRLFRLNDLLNRRFETLSGGQRRRVDLARALIQSPQVLFLDEPTTGLDPLTRKELWDIIADLRKTQGLTVLLTTHYMEEADEADEIVILQNGNIVADDTPLALKNAYSHTKLILHAPKEETKALIQKTGWPFEETAKTICACFPSDVDITSFLFSNRDCLGDYEVIKGNLDDVFLRVTGKRMGD